MSDRGVQVLHLRAGLDEGVLDMIRGALCTAKGSCWVANVDDVATFPNVISDPMRPRPFGGPQYIRTVLFTFPCVDCVPHDAPIDSMAASKRRNVGSIFPRQGTNVEALRCNWRRLAQLFEANGTSDSD